MTLEITEVIRRAEQGVTRPFICRAADGNTYFVKGRGAGRRSLIAEWMCSRLARHLGLPVPDCVIANVPAEFAEPGLIQEFSELGTGFVFASLAVPAAYEYSLSHLGDTDTRFKKDLLVFDWWIQNGDRTLTERGGNPNLLWDPAAKCPVVIDHTQAFEHVEPETFFALHVFADSYHSAFNDLVERAQYQARLLDALDVFDEACAEIPEEWYFVDDGVAVNFDVQETRALLERCTHPEFWGVTP